MSDKFFELFYQGPRWLESIGPYQGYAEALRTAETLVVTGKSWVDIKLYTEQGLRCIKRVTAGEAHEGR